MNIITIIGASGVGKTSLSEAYHKKNNKIPFNSFDTIGVPTTEVMINEYGSVEEWQRQKTIEWMNKIVSENKYSDWALLEGQTRPQFVNEGYKKENLTNSFIICLWCNAETMQKRLSLRKQPELFNEKMVNWNNYLKKWSEECPNAVVVDTSDGEMEENVSKLEKAISDIMGLYINLLQKREKSVLLMILGLLLFCFPVFILVWRYLLPVAHNVPLLDTISYSVLFISGAGLMIAGSGGSFHKIFGKAFIMIDKEKISIKNKPYTKVQLMLWNDIKTIQIDSCKYHITTCNNNKQIIDLSLLDYSIMKDVKKTLICIAMEKGLVIDEI